MEIQAMIFMCLCVCVVGILLRTFVPLFPERLWVEERIFCCVFPFHIVFDETVSQALLIAEGYSGDYCYIDINVCKEVAFFG